MDCGECGGSGGEPVRVEYTDGTTETIPLCEQCRERFTDGDLISRVEPLDAE